MPVLDVIFLRHSVAIHQFYHCYYCRYYHWVIRDDNFCRPCSDYNIH